jgi:uncharacterized membrane protein HdeD (DUF308 family)
MFTAVRGVGAETGGVMLIVAGVAFAVERFTPIEGVWRWLPLFVIYLAARDLRLPPPGRRPSVVPLLSGIWLLITTIGFLGFDLLNSWPLLIVLVGLGLIVDGIVYAERAAPQAPGGE